MIQLRNWFSLFSSFSISFSSALKSSLRIFSCFSAAASMLLELLNKIGSVFNNVLTYIFPLPTCGEKSTKKPELSDTENRSAQKSLCRREVKFVW
jgi:hypothetical protein